MILKTSDPVLNRFLRLPGTGTIFFIGDGGWPSILAFEVAKKVAKSRSSFVLANQPYWKDTLLGALQQDAQVEKPVDASQFDLAIIDMDLLVKSDGTLVKNAYIDQLVRSVNSRILLTSADLVSDQLYMADFVLKLRELPEREQRGFDLNRRRVEATILKAPKKRTRWTQITVDMDRPREVTETAEPLSRLDLLLEDDWI